MIEVAILRPTIAQVNPFVWVYLAVVVLAMLIFWLFFVRVFGLWLRAFLARAPISVPQLVGMILRKVDAKEIVRLKIMAVQSGVDIPTQELERAYLTGADVERAVLAMVRAKETGKPVTWDDVIRADRDERLDEALPSESRDQSS